MTLQNRLIKFISYKGMTVRAFEDSVGLSNGAVSKMGENTRRSTLDKISNTYPDLNMIWVRTGEGEMLTTARKANQSDDFISTRPRIPFDAAAGSLSLLTESVSEFECERFPIIDRFPQYDFTIMVKGDSMEPEFKSGDEIACRFIIQPSFIQWGRPHVLDTKQGVVLKRIYDGGNSILCKSDNQDYKNFEIPKTEILHIALVVGSVRLY